MGKRAGILLCAPFEEKKLLKWEPPFIIQPKLDGERCRALVAGGEVVLLSSEQNTFSSVPHINDAIRRLDLPEGTELDGELYVHGQTFEEIHSKVSRTVELHPRYTEMEFHIFDIISVEDPQMIQGARHKLLQELPLQAPLIRVESHIIFTLPEVYEYYNYYLSLSYEGIILRNIWFPYLRTGRRAAMKFKPKKKDFYQIIAFEEAIDKYGKEKNTLGAFLCEGASGEIFKVGAGKLDHAQRDYIWENQEKYLNRLCEVQYQNITEAGVPRFGLCCKEPEEISSEDTASDKFLKALIKRR